jgi:hypothetical protein
MKTLNWTLATVSKLLLVAIIGLVAWNIWCHGIVESGSFSF